MAGEGTRWRFPKLPDWLIYAAVVVALLAAALSRRENADAPPAPPPLSREEGRLLPSASTFAPRSVIKVSADPSGPQSGAAFSIASKGVWLTARHVIAGCSRIALMEAPDKAAEARAAPEGDLEPPTDVAVLTTQGGAPPLALADGAGLRIGERGFHPGFPQGRAGEVTTRPARPPDARVSHPRRRALAHARGISAVVGGGGPDRRAARRSCGPVGRAGVGCAGAGCGASPWPKRPARAPLRRLHRRHPARGRRCSM